MSRAVHGHLSARQAAEVTSQLLRHDWAIAIVTALSAGPRRFGELQSEINAVDEQAGRHLHRSAITNRTLSTTLARLVDENVVRREERGSHPTPVVWYELTTAGYALIPVLDAMAAWQRRRVARLPGRPTADVPAAAGE